MGSSSRGFRALWLVPRSEHLPNPRIRKPFLTLHLLIILIARLIQ